MFCTLYVHVVFGCYQKFKQVDTMGFLKVKIAFSMKSNMVIWIHWLCIYVCSYKKPKTVEST